MAVVGKNSCLISIAVALFYFVRGAVATSSNRSFLPLAFSATAPKSSPQAKILKSIHADTTAKPVCSYFEVQIPTSKEGAPPCQDINVEDLTPTIQSLLADAKMTHGSINIISRHTTTALTINESESRLAQDMRAYFLNLAPPDGRSTSVAAQDGVRYFHNDIEQRPDSDEEAQRCRDNGWDIDDAVELQKWRDQEPINSHSHLLSMLLGTSESIPVVDGKMVIGQWQSILLVDLDGPRDRTVGVQFNGYE